MKTKFITSTEISASASSGKTESVTLHAISEWGAAMRAERDEAIEALNDLISALSTNGPLSREWNAAYFNACAVVKKHSP